MRQWLNLFLTPNPTHILIHFLIHFRLSCREHTLHFHPPASCRLLTNKLFLCLSTIHSSTSLNILRFVSSPPFNYWIPHIQSHSMNKFLFCCYPRNTPKGRISRARESSLDNHHPKWTLEPCNNCAKSEPLGLKINDAKCVVHCHATR